MSKRPAPAPAFAVRGGGWKLPPGLARAATVSYDAPGIRFKLFGVRLVRRAA